DLTVTGGWNPGSGTTTSTSNFNNTRIVIGSSTSPWGGSVSVNNITMTFTQNDTPPATPENGLTIYSAGNVALSNVEVSVANSAGAEIEAAGNVTVNNSKFHRNKTAGAIIRAGGNVDVANSEFQNPQVNRQRRQIVGLDVNSGGAVSLFNIMASGNREVGVNIVAGDAVSIDTGVFSGTMEIKDSNGSSVFDGTRDSEGREFLGYGLRVETPSRIAVQNITANNNFLWGAFLIGGGDIAVRDSIFNANTTESPGFIDDTGLFVRGGSNVTLTNITANDNRLFGTDIEAAGNVTVADSTFNNNRGVVNTGSGDTFHGHGMRITSLADIFIDATDASGNMLFGGQLNASGQVVISNSTFNNTSTGSAANAVGKGLEIVSGDLADLFQVQVNNSQSDGATIQAGGTINLTEVTASDNGGDGVEAHASCVNVMGGTYSGNAEYGLNLGSSALNLIAPPSFSGNGAGDMFPEDPPTCTFSFGGSTSGAATNVFTSMTLATESSTSDSRSLSLAQFLASSRTAHGSIFFGQYAYADTAAGIQVFALVPAFDVLAKE
ncbi:MAG TPA: right-handed parallel beta-helix repeat-containing protein, partial [Anaerolineales bacterium]|nr:right-handed parallel beta-helix repeat-containing protein [Anaerolineales bacterium]